MVGWPANGISALEVKISIWTWLELAGGSWRNTTSDRLNSDAIRCFCSWVRDGREVWGTGMMASGFPSYLVLVKTSTVVNESFIPPAIEDSFVSALFLDRCSL